MSHDRLISSSFLRDLLDYNPETGIFTRRHNIGNRKDRMAGSIAGSLHVHGYVVIGVANNYYKAHRLAWLHFYGEWPKQSIDHINGNKQDNRIKNLREATAKLNAQNQ